ncbi:Ras-related protein Rab-4 [Tritrichomonas foetus]|uniref:Ras-related protein Rab-4 n=1 Tax=Tritrichomonas foetus TaxID=1144522 RepID=A0A1J4K3K7_9EUKA|nr:Ras-related protein Rab-4 [Tritrichomonas foetus]|eukprot:OHT05416.1 Ras-related protein Rab-4 [Tritrichomonas foetus]
MNKEDNTLRVIVVGDSTVGKTAVIIKFVDNVSACATTPTIGVDFKTKQMNIDGQDIKFQLWDTAGQERFRTLAVSYFRKAQGIALFYDVTNRDSFNHLQSWIESINSHIDAAEGIPIIVLGNKIDKVEERKVTTEEAEKEVNNFYKYFETSALTGEGINEAFTYLATAIYRKHNIQATIESKTDNTSVDLTNSGKKHKKKCCA